jgi:hypothetical protein
VFSEIVHSSTDKIKQSKWKYAIYAGFLLVASVLICILALLFFPDLFINKYLKYRIVNEFSSAYPGYSINISELHFNLLENSIEFGSIEIISNDSTFSCNFGRSSLKGISWLKLIWKEGIFTDVISHSIADMQEVTLKSQKLQYEFHCGHLHASLNDSVIVTSGLELHPLGDDNHFFEASSFRRTRIRMVLPKLKLSGLDCSGLLQGKLYRAGFIQIPDILLDVLVNIGKPYNQDTSITIISDDILNSLKEMIDIDSLNISKGEIKYSECDSSGSNIDNEFTKGQTGYSINISELHSNILEKSMEFDSVIFNSGDSDFSCSLDKTSIRGIDWLQLLWKGDIDPDIFTGLVANVHEIFLKSQDLEYEFHSGQVHISFPDSEIVLNEMEVHPLLDDNEFFDESKYRKTRYRMALTQLRVNGLSCLELLKGNIYHTRSIQINDASLDVLVNMYKPYERQASKTLMPNEMLTDLKEIIKVDSFIILNGQLIYAERYTARANPAVLRFDNSYLLAEGISNDKNCGDTITIHANAIFQNGGLMKLIMLLPLKSPKFSMIYSGSVSTMNLNKLNSFLEIAERKRIKSGIIQSGSFDIQVKDGHAKGNVRTVYKDLTLALLDSKIRSENGIFNRITSFIANNFKLHVTNKKDESGTLKLGKVNYSRKRDDTFLQFAWFALRSGIANIVGF